MARPRKSAAVHKANGNPGDRPLRVEPKPRPVKPTRPAQLSEAGGKVWDRVTAELEFMGILVAADQDLLLAYSCAVADFLECERITQDEGLTLDTREGQRAHPAAKLKKELAIVIKTLASELGLSNQGRAKLGKVPEHKSEAEQQRDKLRLFIAGTQKTG